MTHFEILSFCGGGNLLKQGAQNGHVTNNGSFRGTWIFS